MKNAAAQELSTEILNKLQHYQISFHLILQDCQQKDIQYARANAEIAAMREREVTHEAEKDRLREIAANAEAAVKSIAESLASRERECAELRERMDAAANVFDALVESHRPYGLDRRKFRRKITSISRRTPTDGPQAVRHAVLLSEARKVLEPGA